MIPKENTPSENTSVDAVATNFFAPSMTERLEQRQKMERDAAARSQATMNDTMNQYRQYQQDYSSGKRNPIADLIRKPERDLATENRQKQAAKWSFIGDAIGLIGKGFAASRGARLKPTESKGVKGALGELKRLNDIYRQEGYRYDNNVLMDAIRRQDVDQQWQRDQANMAQREYEYSRNRADQADAAILNVGMARERAAAEQAEQLRRENVERQNMTRQFEHQNRLQNSRVAAERTSRGSGGRSGNGEYNLPSSNIALGMTDSRTGRPYPIPDGDYALYLKEAMKEDPKLEAKLSGRGIDPQQRQQYADEAVASYIKSKNEQEKVAGEVTRDAQQLKSKGYTNVSLEALRKYTGDSFTNIPDDTLIDIFKQQGIEITTTNNYGWK